MIKQSELNQLKALEATADEAVAAYAELKKTIIKRLQALEHVQVGDWQACLIPLSRRNPSWKEAYVRDCGIEAAEAVTKATTPSVSESLKVTLRPGVPA